MLVTRTDPGAEIDAEATVIARHGRTPASPSDALAQPHTRRDCGEAIHDRDHHAVFCLDCLRRRKNTRDRAYNKANPERPNDYRREWRRRRRQRLKS